MPIEYCRLFSGHRVGLISSTAILAKGAPCNNEPNNNCFVFKLSVSAIGVGAAYLLVNDDLVHLTVGSLLSVYSTSVCRRRVMCHDSAARDREYAARIALYNGDV